MKRKSALVHICLLGLCSSFLVRAAEKPPVTKTENLDFPLSGTLRVEHSTGILQIEGWDQDGAEITTTKSIIDTDSARKNLKESSDMDSVQVSAKRQGGELVVDTAYPSHRAFPYITTLDHATDFNLNYLIKVPRNASVIVSHDDGEVYISDIAGSIEVTQRQGVIVLQLSGASQPAIDAKSKIGNVYSDFPGTPKTHELFIGHTLQNGANSARNLKLRTGYGDIFVQKMFQPKP